MPVYVDDMKAPHRHMLMCHMVADTHRELMDMASAIGVAHRWLQDAGTSREHFDVCQRLRAMAVRQGAVEISMRELARMVLTRKLQGAGGEDEYYEKASANL
jgi:hypothetical protein